MLEWARERDILRIELYRETCGGLLDGSSQYTVGAYWTGHRNSSFGEAVYSRQYVAKATCYHFLHFHFRRVSIHLKEFVCTAICISLPHKWKRKYCTLPPILATKGVSSNEGWTLLNRASTHCRHQSGRFVFLWQWLDWAHIRSHRRTERLCQRLEVAEV